MTTSPAHLRPAPTQHQIDDLIRLRWSPRGFDPRPMPEAHLQQLLEAARWAPSSYNEQPWRFVLADRNDGESFEAILACLNPNNQLWARNAAALVIAVMKTELSSNGEPNRTAGYDLGQAVASLSLQATAMGISVHQMVGFDADKARAALKIPEGFMPLTAIAIGYAGSVDHLPEAMQKKEVAPRVRKPLAELVFGKTWAVPLWPQSLDRDNANDK